MWNYIEKIDWCKGYHHFLGMKYKALELQISYFGCEAFDVSYSWRRRQDHAGISLEITLLGVLCAISIYDYRHWNEVENRFYLEDEPELACIGVNGYAEEQYFDALKKCAQKHCLDENYLPRCEAAFVEYQIERARQQALYAQLEQEDQKPFQPKHPINWANVKYAKQGKKYKKYAVKFLSNGDIEITEFRTKYRLPVKDVASLFDLYDNKGRLVSQAEEYREEEYEI
ncbi:MAG: hypothetical protein PUK24_01980 [Elusimicrobia bacterium]|nr:hypothetical protein [Elusimicrobiota bacterium]